MKQKPFSKITVSELIRECNVNRKTLYYHFEDIYDSVGRDELKRFFFQDFIGLMEQIIRETEKKCDHEISDEFRQFLCMLYTEGIAGMLINLFQNPEHFDKDSLIDYFSVVIKNSIPSVIMSQKNKKTIMTATSIH